MTREDVIGKIKDEFEKNSIAYESLADNVYSVRVGKKLFLLSFYKQTVVISAYWRTKAYVEHKLMSLDYFYEDITMVWVNEKRLFVQAGRNYNVMALRRD